MTYGEAIAALKPLKDNPKYSENLLRYLLGTVKRLSVLRGQQVSVMSRKGQSATDITDGWLYVGDYETEWITGARLASILHGDFKRWAVPVRSEVIADWWDNYLAHGKCHLDPEHVYYGERWRSLSEDLQVCQWCGRGRVREIVMIPEERWHLMQEVKARDFSSENS